MTVFIPTIPLATDKQSASQPTLRNNNIVLDAVFGIDHYPFSNGTVNKGFHDKVTQPAYSAGSEPSTATDVPVMYAYELTSPLGVLQYSRGGSDAVPSPVTSIQSIAGSSLTLANGATLNILDCTGLAYGSFLITASGITTLGALSIIGVAAVYFNNSASPKISGTPTGGVFRTSASGSVIQLFNVSAGNLTNVRWTINIQRVELV